MGPPLGASVTKLVKGCQGIQRLKNLEIRLYGTGRRGGDVCKGTLTQAFLCVPSVIVSKGIPTYTDLYTTRITFSFSITVKKR